MDHMPISGTEPSSVILGQTKYFKILEVMPKLPKEGKAKRDGVINPQYYTFNEFYIWTIWCSQNATN